MVWGISQTRSDNGKKQKRQETQGRGETGATTAADRQPLCLSGHRLQPQNQTQSQSTGPLPVPPPSGGRVDDKELLTRDKLLQRAAFQGEAANVPEVRVLLNLAGNYQQIIVSNKIPAGDSPNFLQEMGAVNAQIMTAHEQLINTLAETAQTLRQKVPKLPRFLTRNASTARLYNLADDCANLATIAHGQKIYLNKIYDDMITAKQTNPDSLRDFSGKTYSEILRNVEMYRFSSTGSAKALGAGAINTVYRDRFQGQDRVFKRGKTYEHSQTDASGVETNTGFDVMEWRMRYQAEDLYYGDRPAGRVIRADTAQRDVAYSRLNKLFGFDIAVGTQLAKSEEGETSSLMDMGQGETADKFLFYVGEEWSEVARAWAQREHENESANTQKLIEAYKRDIANLNPADPDFEKKKVKMTAEMEEKEKYLEKLKQMGTFQTIDLTNPQVALQLFKLSVLDLVAGHVDRHAGNYMINKTEGGEIRITAIDNDTSFGEGTDIETAKQMQGTGQIRPALEEAFPFVPPEIKERVMSISKVDIEQALTGLLTKPQIDAACIRFEKVQAHFKALEEKHRVEEISRQNMREVFGKNVVGSYQASLFQSRSKSMHTQSWFNKKKESGAPDRPLPRPPGTR